MNRALRRDAKHDGVSLGMSFWVKLAGKIVQIVQDIQSTGTGYGSLILCLKYGAACGI